MTDAWIESCRGSVAAWEVDHVGHFTVAYYHQRIEDAGFAVLETLGLGPSYAQGTRRGCLTAACRVRYLRELRGGDIYHVQSGVVAIEAAALVIGHRIFDSGSGTLCTTVEQRVIHVNLATGEPVDLTPASRGAAESHRVDWPEPPPERRPEPRGDEGFVDGALDTVKPSEMNILGRGALSHYIHRFSASGGHLMAAFGMTPAYMRSEQRGLSTFEFQLAIAAPLQPGDLVRVQSALVHVGNSSIRLFHRMTKPQTGEQVATLEQSGVHLDREARRPVPLPDALRSKARAMLKTTCAVAMLVLLLAAGLDAQPAAPARDAHLAQLTLPTGSGADWRQWDSFLTNVVKKLATDLPESRRAQLQDLFLDSRYQLVQTLSVNPSDPVPSLFLDTWNRLSPILNQSVTALSPQVAGQYKGFITAMDGAASLTGLGQRFGLVQVTPDMLRGASKLLGTGDADPLAYVLDVDDGLRSFLGFTGTPSAPRVSPGLEQGSLRPLAPRPVRNASAALRSWFVAPALAAEDDFDRLNQWVPQAPELNDYLSEVRKLLTQASTSALRKYKLAPQYQPLFRQIVFAAAWQESCWRQFVRKGEKLTPLASATGDVGMMQVNRQTWRGLYDLNGLNGDIEYNSNAGSEILLYYLSRYAIPKKEDKQPGGQLARATYSAYNGGPRALGRYRNANTVPGLKKVDEAFWTKFRSISGGKELAVKSCYGS